MKQKNNMFDINAARKAGASDDQIIEYLTKSRGFDTQAALKAGASKQQIIDHLTSAPKFNTPTPTVTPQEKLKEQPTVFSNNTLAGKAINTVAKAGQGAANFLFGSTSKTVGSLIGSGVESARNAIVSPEKQTHAFVDEHAMPKMLTGQSGTHTAADIAFTGLELYPGGGALRSVVEKIPGGVKIAEGIASHLKMIPDNLKERAVKQYASLFKATSKESKGLVKKVVPTLLESNKIITSTKKLAEQAGEKLSESGSKINELVSNLSPKIKINLKPAVNTLEKMKSNYMVAGKVADQSKINAIENVQKTISNFGNSLAAKDTIKLRRILDESVNDAGGFIADKASKFTAKVEKAASDSLRSAIAKKSPDLDAANKAYSLWSNVKKLASYTEGKQSGIVRQGISGGIGATIVGIETPGGVGNKLGGAAIGGVLGAKAIEFIKSPAWKSVSAITKNKIADNLAKGSKSEIINIFKKLGIGAKNTLSK